MSLEALASGLTSIVPNAKQMAWFGGVVMASFAAGASVYASLGERAALPERVDSLAVSVGENTTGLRTMAGELGRVRTELQDGLQSTRAELQQGIQDVQDGLAATRDDLDRIRCLARISAMGDAVSPLEIDDLCP